MHEAVQVGGFGAEIAAAAAEAHGVPRQAPRRAAHPGRAMRRPLEDESRVTVAQIVAAARALAAR